MCGRYVSPEEAAIERAVEIQRRSWSSRFRSQGLIGARYNVSPTDPVPVVRVVREVDGQREGVHLRWGLIPYWAQGKPMGNTINARIETVRTNSSYRDAWNRGQRCLVALSGFYEWQAQPLIDEDRGKYRRGRESEAGEEALHCFCSDVVVTVAAVSVTSVLTVVSVFEGGPAMLVCFEIQSVPKAAVTRVNI